MSADAKVIIGRAPFQIQYFCYHCGKEIKVEVKPSNRIIGRVAEHESCLDENNHLKLIVKTINLEMA